VGCCEGQNAVNLTSILLKTLSRKHKCYHPMKALRENTNFFGIWFGLMIP